LSKNECLSSTMFTQNPRFEKMIRVRVGILLGFWILRV
jgi:hypothetical protein